MIWLVQPTDKSTGIWPTVADGAAQSGTIQVDGELTGDTVLPGFSLSLNRLCPD